MKSILEWLSNEGYGTVDSDFYSYINEWEQWYKGKTKFHKYRQYNGRKSVTKVRKTLGMSKKVAEDWANLLLNEKVEIILPEQNQERFNEIIATNKFGTKSNQLVELAFALGTGAMVEFIDNGNISIDYIRANMIYPIGWQNGEITDCAFASEHKVGKDTVIYLNIHEKTDNGYHIINKYFKKSDTGISEIELPDNIKPEYTTDRCMFQIIKPNIVNNIDLDNPMGVSVYANSLDQLEGVDTTYDSYVNEFQLGKKRIIVPMTMARMVADEEGMSAPMFDPNDTEFYAVQATESENKIVEMNMEIRADAHEQGLKTGLNILAKKCGLGDSYYRFEGSGVKTATEVVSEESDLYRNLRKHEIILHDALVNLAVSVMSLDGTTIDPSDVTVNFDDSIIEDVGAEKQRFMNEIAQGVRQKWEYRAKFFGEAEEEAKANVQEDTTETWFNME